MKIKPRAFDVLGTIAILKFPKNFRLKDKKKFAENLLKRQKSIKTILEKKGNFKGRLRKQETRHLAGEKTKEVLYKENNCIFRFNVDSAYFSPRLSNERKEIAGKIKKNDKVLVMFSGVNPYGIVIAKTLKNQRFLEPRNPRLHLRAETESRISLESKAKVVSVEINKEANKYARLNSELNNLVDNVQIVQGDIKKVTEKFVKQKKKFDVIVMPRPRLKETFLKQAFSLSKKGTKIYYYDFCKVDDAKKSEIFGTTKSQAVPSHRSRSKDFVGVDSIIEKIKTEAKKYKKKIKILKTKTAGEIAPYKIRVRIDFRIL